MDCVCVLQAQCLYDFEGDTDNGELSFYSGDVLTIIRQVTILNTSVNMDKEKWWIYYILFWGGVCRN